MPDNIEGCAIEDVGDGDGCLNIKKYVKCPFLSYLSDLVHNFNAIRLTFLREPESMKTQERQCTLSKNRMIKLGVNSSLVAMSSSTPLGRAWKIVQPVDKYKFLGNINNLRLNVQRCLALAWVPRIWLPCVGKNEGGIESEEQSIRCMEKELDPATLRYKWMLVWNDNEPLLSETDNSRATAFLNSQWDDHPDREVDSMSVEVTALRMELTDLEVQEHDDAQIICQSMGRPEHGLDHSGDLIFETNLREERTDAVMGGETPFYISTGPIRGDLIKVSPEESSLSKTINKWDMFPEIVQDMVLSYLPAKDLFKARLVCKKFCNLLPNSERRELFEETRAKLVHTEGVYSPLYFTTDEVGWHWGGLDVAEKKWSTLPSLECLPAPDPELFKDFLVAGGGGLLCVNVEKSPKDEKLFMCNPMKQQKRELPPLNCRRHPVLMHVLVDKDKNSYKVIVAGSSTIGTEDRSLKTEVYDSTTGAWRVTGNLPLPEFGLNEYQNGAYYKDEKGKGWLFCVAVLEEGGKGVIAYDIDKGEWLSNWKLPIPPVNCQACFATTQMIECSGQVYLFSEQESGKDVWFCIHRLKVDAAMGGGAWEKLMTTKRKGNRGLLVYPEFICVPSGEDELCIFNTVEYTMETYNVDRMLDSPVVQKTPAPFLRGKSFHSLNPLGFKFEPNFGAKV